MICRVEMLKILKSTLEEILAHAKRDLPIKACGYLAERDAVVVKSYQLENTDQPGIHFTFNPEEQFDMEFQGLDITKDHCPITFVKVKVQLAKLKKGDQLEVLLCEGEPLKNVPRSAEEQGHKVLGIEPAGEFFKVRIEKGT